jgi:membrane protein DedA with SNARE-associated domain
MLNAVLEHVGSFIVATISMLGYPGIVLMMAVESACIPLPSEIIMPFYGYLVSTGQLSLLGVATAGALGCNIGSAAAYWIGATGGRSFVRRWGHYVLLRQEEVDLAEKLFSRYGAATVLVARLLPVIRTFIALPAGFARMSQWRFHLYTFIGSWIWCLVLALIGRELGVRWNDSPWLQSAFRRADILIVVAILVCGAFCLWRRLKARTG